MSIQTSYALLLFRQFCTCNIKFKQVKMTNLKGKSVSSQHWLKRQAKDPYVERANVMNYRCRSAFKLLEIDDRFKIFKSGQVVVDCGAAPGSWTQVALQRINADENNANQERGAIIAIDRFQIFPIENAYILGNSDFTKDETQNKVREILDGRLVDVVMSDMAPQATGIKYLDQENIIKLCYVAFKFALSISSVNSTFLVKLWQGAGAKNLETDLLKFYKTVKIVKPLSSRSDSAEIFMLAREFRGLKK